MKKSKFTEAQIVFALRQAETGTRIDEVCRKIGISEATFYNQKKKYGGLGVSELRKLRQLREENLQLKKLVADKGDAFNGFILVRRIMAPGCAIILDHSGNIIWYDLRDIMLMNPFSWTANNTIIWYCSFCSYIR